MSQQVINLGAGPDDNSGDALRIGGEKINDNFTELYEKTAALEGSERSGLIVKLSYADALAGQPYPEDTGIIVYKDDGEHVDPFTNQPVPNAGIYHAEPGGLRWIRSASTDASDISYNGRPLDEVLDPLFAPKIASLVIVPAVIEYGSAEERKARWTLTADAMNQQVAEDGGDLFAVAAGVREHVLSFDALGDHLFSLVVDDGLGNADDRQATAYARVPVFVGISVTNPPTQADIRAAQYKSLDSDATARSLTLDRSAGGFIFIVLPAARVLSIIELGGFAVVGWVTSDSFDLELGTGQDVPVRMTVLDPPLVASANSIGVKLA